MDHLDAEAHTRGRHGRPVRQGPHAGQQQRRYEGDDADRGPEFHGVTEEPAHGSPEDEAEQRERRSKQPPSGRPENDADGRDHEDRDPASAGHLLDGLGDLVHGSLGPAQSSQERRIETHPGLDREGVHRTIGIRGG